MTMKMLVVEDNELAGTAVTTLFETLGFDVHLIINGLDVLPYLEENNVDVIILDLELPGMTGDKIYAKIREKSNYKNTPIVPFTAHRETNVADSLPANLIFAEYTKTGKIPEIVFKGDGTKEDRDINKQLVDEVAFAMMKAEMPITEKMAQWYMKTRGLTPTDIMKNM
jgi:CheY-like chemotaxis protein